MDECSKIYTKNKLHDFFSNALWALSRGFWEDSVSSMTLALFGCAEMIGNLQRTLKYFHFNGVLSALRGKFYLQHFLILSIKNIHKYSFWIKNIRNALAVQRFLDMNIWYLSWALALLKIKRFQFLNINNSFSSVKYWVINGFISAMFCFSLYCFFFVNSKVKAKLRNIWIFLLS